MPLTAEAIIKDDTRQPVQQCFYINDSLSMILCLTLSEGQGDGTLWHAEKPLTPALSRREVNALCQSIGMRGTMHWHGMPPHRLAAIIRRRQ
jgi:hypothetical protein